jgi:hypothetical protein
LLSLLYRRLNIDPRPAIVQNRIVVVVIAPSSLRGARGAGDDGATMMTSRGLLVT